MTMDFYWDGDSNENIFMEVTDRDDLGSDLLAPLAARGGNRTGSYRLVPEVSAGAVVIHYDSTEQAIRGVSVALGDPEPSPIWWAAHGSNALADGVEPSWLEGLRVPLGATRWLDDPVTLEDIRSQERALLAIRDHLQSAHGEGTPLYFPWVPYSGQPIRTFQTYLAKFPREALGLFPDLFDAITEVEDAQLGPFNPPTPTEMAEAAVADAAGRGERRRGQGFILDQQAKVAIEVRAMNEAIAYYEADGWEVEDVHGNRPYDLVCNKGAEELRVEVKGTTTDGEEVLLTPNEVEHARTFKRVALFVVSNILLQRDEHGVTASGGSIGLHDPWHVDDGALTPLGYRHSVPPGAERF